MKSITCFLSVVLFVSCCLPFDTIGQGSPAPDTTRPILKPVNAGFDVIIKKNGEILYGIVKEVSEKTIRYQRTDIPDGPIYLVSRDEVYAISYRNQVKDILNPMKDSIVHDTVVVHDAPVIQHDSASTKVDSSSSMPGTKPKNTKTANFFKAGQVKAGIGFFRSYTKVSQVSQYASSVNFPVINIGYDVQYTDQVRLGVQIAFGPHKFTGQQYSSYDSTQSAVTLKENIFMIDVYGKYNIAYRTARLQPYIIGGIGIHSSHISSSYNITFINDPNHSVLVNSGNNSVGLGIIARIGTEYLINKRSRLFGDVGIGPTILNVGISFNVD